MSASPAPDLDGPPAVAHAAAAAASALDLDLDLANSAAPASAGIESMSMMRTTTPAAAAPVPDVLLSLVKSSRYTSHLSDLLVDLVAPYLSHYHANGNGNGGHGDSGNNSNSRSKQLLRSLKPEINLVAALLHAMLVTWRQGRSMGMDVAGLRYCSEELLRRRRRRGAKTGGGNGGTTSTSSSSISSESEGWDLAPADARLVPPPASAPSHINMATSMLAPSSSLSGGGKSKSLPEQLGTCSRSLLLVALTVLPPYLEARCGRTGGWDELREALGGLLLGSSSSSSDDGGASSSNANNDNGGNAASAAGNATVEHLRGRSRREIFEERRRAMVQMASKIESGDTNGKGTLANNNDHGEAVRREGGDAHTTITTASERQLQSDRVRQKYLAILRRLCRSGTDWFRQAYIATLSLPTAAHTIARNNMTDSNGSSSSNGNSDEQMEARADSRASIIRWILRLNLALFYLNGKYPTLAHRLAGVRLSSDTPSNRTMVSSAQGLVSPGISDRPSYRMIGALILLEAGAALAGTINRMLVEIVHRVEMRRAAAASRSSNGSTAASSSAVDSEAAAAAERDRLLDLVEQRAPSVLTYEKQMREAESCSIERVGASKQANQSASRSSCGICMHDRKHPAAPISCGHVFCWSCIIHWSTRVRPECPLCRAPAKPQDIIALYNY